MSEPNKNATYIGDGVYVSTEFGQLAITVNHRANNVVYLEPEVLKNLVKYARNHKLINLKEIEQ